MASPRSTGILGNIQNLERQLRTISEERINLTEKLRIVCGEEQKISDQLIEMKAELRKNAPSNWGTIQVSSSKENTKNVVILSHERAAGFSPPPPIPSSPPTTFGVDAACEIRSPTIISNVSARKFKVVTIDPNAKSWSPKSSNGLGLPGSESPSMNSHSLNEFKINLNGSGFLPIAPIRADDGLLYSPYLKIRHPKLYELVALGVGIKDLGVRGGLFKNKLLASISGPILSPDLTSVNDPKEEVFGNLLCGKTISTYPLMANAQGVRMGDPICDRFGAHIFPQSLIACVTDGCSWGSRPRNAAIHASDAFIDYLSNNLSSNVKGMAKKLLKAVTIAHNSVLEGAAKIEVDAGTTTLIGGVLMRLERKKGKSRGTKSAHSSIVQKGKAWGEDWFGSDSNFDKLGPIPKWAFACVSVGDCKAFHYNKANKTITDITEGNRGNFNPTDPGGRLGPTLGDRGLPDTRNMDLFVHPCEDGDLIILCSDGVHDCLDPTHVGKFPRDFANISSNVFKCGDDWRKAEDEFPQEVEAIISQYRRQKLESLVIPIVSRSSGNTPHEVSRTLTEYCYQLTQSSRDWMAENPKGQMPKDYVLLPGKMDHTTVLVFEVRRASPKLME